MERLGGSNPKHDVFLTMKNILKMWAKKEFHDINSWSIRDKPPYLCFNNYYNF